MEADSMPKIGATLVALLDRLIPEDSYPGAVVAGVDAYVLRYLTGRAEDASAIEAGLTRLAAVGFAELDPGRQVAIMAELDEVRDPFFTRMIVLAHEGFYSDPGSGGNRDGVAWRMLGYQTGVPEER